jgi:hypothetical protein
VKIAHVRLLRLPPPDSSPAFPHSRKKPWPRGAFWRVSARSTQPGTPLATVFERIGNCLKKYEKSSDMFIITPEH